MNNDLKICSKCHSAKKAEGNFYTSQGKFRSECKVCTIRHNVVHQRKTKAWKHRFIDDEGKRSYMVDYYSKNKEKFKEYRRQFKEKYPDYHREYQREYYRKRKSKKQT